jgi:hypothetical protein
MFSWFLYKTHRDSISLVLCFGDKSDVSTGNRPSVNIPFGRLISAELYLPPFLSAWLSVLQLSLEASFL